MKKLSKEDSKRHNQAMDLVHSDKALTYAEKLFILENYQESATNLNSIAGAFFTPLELAADFCLEVHEGRIIDLCAGIGALSFTIFHRQYATDLTCIDINTEYVMVGKRILPEAKWIVGDITDKELISSLSRFRQAIGNPPFGRIKANSTKWAGYSGSDFEYKAIMIGSQIADYGTFIIPQESCPFQYSGNNGIEYNKSSKLLSFEKETKIDMQFNVGIDTSYFQTQWKGVSPIVEIVNIDYAEWRDNLPRPMTLF